MHKFQVRRGLIAALVAAGSLGLTAGVAVRRHALDLQAHQEGAQGGLRQLRRHDPLRGR